MQDRAGSSTACRGDMLAYNKAIEHVSGTVSLRQSGLYYCQSGILLWGNFSRFGVVFSWSYGSSMELIFRSIESSHQGEAIDKVYSVVTRPRRLL